MDWLGQRERGEDGWRVGRGQRVKTLMLSIGFQESIFKAVGALERFLAQGPCQPK